MESLQLGNKINGYFMTDKQLLRSSEKVSASFSFAFHQEKDKPYFLVGGFHPFEKYANVKVDHFLW